MIKLIGVLTEGGVPIKVRSSVDSEGELIVGPLIEATKALSVVIGSGEVRQLGFREDTLIVTESKKGYTVVALVSKAEGYMNSLLKVIADAIDSSELPPADGSVQDLHKATIAEIIEPYVRSHISISFPEAFSSVWEPIYEKMRSTAPFSSIVAEVDELLETTLQVAKWSDFRTCFKCNLEDALSFAMKGEFDRACALAMDSDSPAAKAFAVKMGALAHTMTRIVPPPLSDLKRLAEEIPDQFPLADFVRTLAGFISGEVIPADYSRAFREATNRFEFVDNQEHALMGFLFLDPRVVSYPEFAKKMRAFYDGKSEIVCSFIDSIEERGRIFDKLYSITSYDAFRDDLGIYKARITGILSSINWVVDPELVEELRREGKAIEIAVTASLKLQNYIALLTALAESPVLTISERKGVLEEVLMFYRDYFRSLMVTDMPLFSYTLDSVFQSLSVAHAEYYFLSTGDDRARHLDEITAFLNDIFTTIRSEWAKARVRFSLFVVTNAICPVIVRSGVTCDNGVRLAYLAVRLQDLDTIDAKQITKPLEYATNLGNAMTTLTALAALTLDGETRSQVLKTAVDVSLEVYEWFISRGVICRDDIVSTSYHTVLVAADLDDTALERTVKRIIALNKIVVQDPEKHDYELAMMASPLIDCLLIAHNRLRDTSYNEMAKAIYLLAHDAWVKYGFQEKADNFRKKYKDLQ
ncbi:MAG: hypothetical protein ACTSV3_08575 [Candidatus Thorarchaeota archaeon]|nr:MAG: hypothetical protein DRP09_11965 [Candidatus Thorarchaeota archaeon]RLI59861.1 MAG: hypothetical protein DRO87_01545 [Candidatus Thorarchaeota archaeon]